MGFLIAITITGVVSFVGGGFIVFFYLERRRQQLTDDSKRLATAQEQLNKDRHALENSRKHFAEQTNALRKAADALQAREGTFNAQRVSYEELQRENELCKLDFRNIAMSIAKSRFDVEETRVRQISQDERAQELARRYLKSTVREVSRSINSRNFTPCKERLADVIQSCRNIGFEIPQAEETDYFNELKKEFELAVRAEMQREEQARIRAQIREEQKVAKEAERQIQQAEREKAAVQRALDSALAVAADAHSAEIEQLRQQLAEAEANSQRAISRAQMTRAGHVYVISNLGTFGKGVFKIGMTRREDPKDRVIELGDASAPFPFDIHMMISSPDAPKLENALHRALNKLRLNRVNPRKEFFRTDLDAIVKIVESQHGKVDYIADEEALEYRQSQSMPEEDAAFIEQIFNVAEEDEIPIDEP